MEVGMRYVHPVPADTGGVGNEAGATKSIKGLEGQFCIACH